MTKKEIARIKAEIKDVEDMITKHVQEYKVALEEDNKEACRDSEYWQTFYSIRLDTLKWVLGEKP